MVYNGCHLERSPDGLLMDSRCTPGKLLTQFQEFTWTPDGLHQDPWLSVTTSNLGCQNADHDFS